MSASWDVDETWCHIYGPSCWHSPVRIQGTREALKLIRDAIDYALETGMDGNAKHLFSSDGEGYSVEVQVRNFKFLEEQSLPYIAPHANGIGAEMMEHEKRLNRDFDQQVAWSTYYQTRNPQ